MDRLELFGDGGAAMVPWLSRMGLARATAAGHRCMLRRLKALLAQRQDLLNAPIAVAIIELLTMEQRMKKWAPSTLLVKLATAQGALALAPLYARAHPITLSGQPLWAQAMRAARRMSVETPPKQASPATEKEIQAVFNDDSTHMTVRACLLLMWLSAARGGCMRQMSRENLRVGPIQEDGSVPLVLAFHKGKSVRMRGPYTVHTSMPAIYVPRFIRWLQSASTRELFKEVQGRDLLLALRSVRNDLEQRSVRRGSIQRLAETGVSEDQLILFSGHTNVTMMRRYLGFTPAKAVEKAMVAQARIAFG